MKGTHADQTVAVEAIANDAPIIITEVNGSSRRHGGNATTRSTSSACNASATVNVGGQCTEL